MLYYLFIFYQSQHERGGKLEEEGEEEILTHRGQKLAEIEQFDDPDFDSDEDDDGRLGGIYETINS